MFIESDLPQVRVVTGSTRQADRNAGAEVRWREGEERGVDDPARLPQVHVAEKVRGHHGDGQGGKAIEPEAARGSGGSLGQSQRSRENGLS